MASEMIFEFCVCALAFPLPWQPIKFRGLDKNDMFSRGQLKENFCKSFVEISAGIEIPMKAYLHFSHYKSMETLSCHSNESTCIMAIKKHSFCRG